MEPGNRSGMTRATVRPPSRPMLLNLTRPFQPYLEQNVPLLQVAREVALPIRRAKRSVQRYRRFGLAGLTRRGRADYNPVAPP